MDAHGEPHEANAALIVAAVNAAWKQEQLAAELAPTFALLGAIRDSGPCVPERSEPGSVVNVESAPDGTLRKREAPLSADCRLPLLHEAGCICRRLLEP